MANSVDTTPLLPPKLWEIIAGYVKDPQDMLALSHTCSNARKATLEAHRRFFCFCSQLSTPPNVLRICSNEDLARTIVQIAQSRLHVTIRVFVRQPLGGFARVMTCDVDSFTDPSLPQCPDASIILDTSQTVLKNSSTRYGGSDPRYIVLCHHYTSNLPLPSEADILSRPTPAAPAPTARQTW